MSGTSIADRRFLDARRERRHVGLYVVPTLLVTVGALAGGLYAWWPLSINPMHAAVHFEGLPIEKGTVTTYAITTAVLLNLLLLSMAITAIVALVAAYRERRYLRVVDALSTQREAPDKAALVPGNEPAFETRTP